MSDTFSAATTTPPPSDPAGASERRLVRPTEGRVVAGVAAGLASYFGISPVVYRVAFAALVLLGGSGLVLYAAAWLVMPDQRRDESIVEEAIHHHRDRPWLVVGVALVGVGLVLGITGGSFWPNPSRAWLPALAVGLAILWWQRGDRRPAARADGTTAAEGTVGRTGASAPRRRLPLFPLVLGLLVASAGVLGLLQATDTVDVDWTLALAASLVLVGVAAAAGAFFGGFGGLAALGVVLAAALVTVSTVDVPLRGPIGDRVERPSTVLSLHGAYRQSIGHLELDFTRLTLPPGQTTVKASVGVGHLEIRVPAGVRVETRADVSLGEADVLGSTSDGWRVERDWKTPGSSVTAPSLVLDTDVGVGKLEVRRG